MGNTSIKKKTKYFYCFSVRVEVYHPDTGQTIAITSRITEIWGRKPIRTLKGLGNIQDTIGKKIVQDFDIETLLLVNRDYSNVMVTILDWKLLRVERDLRIVHNKQKL